MFIHLTLFPFLRASGEMKTKPTQQSVGKLREIGIQPDILICRTEQAIDARMSGSKIALFCNVRCRRCDRRARRRPHDLRGARFSLLTGQLDRLICSTDWELNPRKRIRTSATWQNF